jgi:hypothetical protein
MFTLDVGRVGEKAGEKLQGFVAAALAGAFSPGKGAAAWSVRRAAIA